MRQEARYPEELETLFEDAFVMRDGQALAELFEDGAVLGDRSREARGGDAIARLAGELWSGDWAYLAGPSRVLQGRDTALIVARLGINVVRRGSDGCWRYAIAFLSSDHASTEEDR
jgi:hypothetical protein